MRENRELFRTGNERISEVASGAGADCPATSGSKASA
jgi:hypothetical protein